jgi:S-methylmethionine-dependent homocysteine/selenocysteine methylase
VIADGNQAVAQLLTGDIDILGPETLGAGAEAEAVFKAGQEGKIQAKAVASPTWEHVDFNLFVK